MQVKVSDQTFTLLFHDLLRPLSESEISGLREDIRRRGEILVPIVTDENYGVIDGGHRITIAGELGLTDVPIEIRPGLTLEEKRSLALALNEHRRHLSQEEKRDLIARRLKATPERSNRQIAEEVGASPTTVGSVREELEATVQIGQLDRTTGKDGKSRPAKVRAESVGDAAAATYFLSGMSDDLPEGAMDVTDLQRIRKEGKRAEKLKQNLKLIENTPPAKAITGETFQAIAIDPPWDWGDEGDVDQFGRGRPVYGTMSIEQITALPVSDLSSKDAHLYLWITNRSLPKGFALMEEWGFRYVTMITWCKPSIGMGNYFRGSTEHVLFGVKGSLPLLRKDVGTWFSANRQGRHSTKPEEFYQLVESCSPGPWLEMFARSQRPGWKQWGAEA